MPLPALQEAVVGRHLNVVKLLAQTPGVNVNMRVASDQGRNALELAAEGGSLEIVRYLVEEAGADVDFPQFEANAHGTTALRTAASSGRADMVRYLISKGAEVNTTSGYSFETALSSAVDEGHDDIVEILVEYGADLDLASVFGETAIETAAHRGRESTVQILLRAKSNTPDLSAAALRAAISGGEIDIAKLILNYGSINVNAADRKSVV